MSSGKYLLHLECLDSVSIVVFKRIFQQYFSFIIAVQFYWRWKPEYSQKTTDLPQINDKLYHIMLKSEIVRTTHFWNNLLQMPLKSKAGKPKH